MTMRDLLTYVGIVAGGTLLFDYLRLRRNEYVDARSAKAAAALAGSTAAPCTTSGCGALRSAVCEDGRCRKHCRLYCECKGNQ